MSNKNWLRWLVGIHLVAACVACALAELGTALLPLDSVFLALSFYVPMIAIGLAQSALVGVWAGLSNQRIGTCLAGIAAALVILEILLTKGLGNSLFRLEPFVITGGAAAFLRVERARGARLVHVREWRTPLGRPTRQVSVGSLMSLVLVTGLLLFSLRAFAGYGMFPNTYEAFCALVIGLAMTRAALAPGAVTVRAAAVLAGAAALGLPVGYAHVGPDGWYVYTWKAATHTLSAVIILTTLCVLRSCGYRLLFRSEPAVESSSCKPQPSAGVPF